MRDVAILILHLIVTMVRLARPGRLRSVVAESVLVKHQLVILNRGRKRAPNLRTADRVIAASNRILADYRQIRCSLNSGATADGQATQISAATHVPPVWPCMICLRPGS